MIEEPEALNNQAIILATSGDYPSAIACLKRAIIISQNNYLIWYNLGITYRDSGDLKNAIHSLKKALQLAPDNQEVLETLATVCVMAGDFPSVLRYAAKGFELNIENPAFWNLAGVAYFNIERYTDASEHFEQALSLNPYYQDALFNLRDTYYELNNKIGARECDKRLKELMFHS